MASGRQDIGGFELPDDNGGEEGGSGGGEFEIPDLGGDSDSTDGSEREGDGESASTGASSLHSALKSITNHLISMAAQSSQVGVQSLEDLEGAGNIVGAAITSSPSDDVILPPGEEGLAVFTAEDTSEENVRRQLCDHYGVQAATDDNAPIYPVCTGLIDAQSHRFRIRPAPGGVSVAHHRVTAGTLGCLVRDGRRLYILSNNHVLANSNNARTNDIILQPGSLDGGVNPRDCIARLHKWVNINFSGGTNYVDCAIGWTDPRLVRRELIYLFNGRRRFFRIGSTPTAARLNTLVGKSGRTTQLTCGRITSVNATVSVNFGQGRIGVFADQIAIRDASNRPFGAPGDSGSVIWNWDARRQPVGLLFAGGNGIIFANKIQRVLSALGVTLYT